VSKGISVLVERNIMSEIGLLMTGVLTTGQPYLPNLPEKQPLHEENDIQNSIQSQLPQVVSTVQITPPEFIETDETFLNTSLSPKSNQENLLKELDKNLSHSSRSLIADSLKVRTRVQKYNNQTLPTIRFGSSGITVRILQRLLIAHGYGMRVDGVFGPLTEAAVKAFQNRRSLFTDGIVGQRTWLALTL
jgi:murein L,D-transpeptidase YcbB/YkuD